MMNPFNLNRILRTVGLIADTPKRVPISQRQWACERLEDRALLSAGMRTSVDTSAAEVSMQRKQSASFPNLVGTWTIVGTGTTTASGNVVVAATGSDDLTATFNLNGLPTITAQVERKNARVRAEISAAGLSEDLHLKGKFNSNHDQMTLRGSVKDPSGGRIRIDMVFTFNSNSNPTSFTATVSASNGVEFTLAGTRVVV